jgi:hypothetical protein
LLAFLIVFLAAGGLRGREPVRAPEAAAPRVVMPAEMPSAQPAPPSAPQESDPLVEQAKREIERARGEIGSPPPNAATDANGRLRLRSGGSISREEWEAARRNVQESPVLREPPPPPF